MGDTGTKRPEAAAPDAIMRAVVPALGETPAFAVGDMVRVGTRAPIGHYRVPFYLRGKVARVEQVIAAMLIDNEEEAYGRNAGSRKHYYRISIPMTALWPEYGGAPRDELRIEVIETWLEAHHAA